jgi:hypothetical protein
MSNPEYRLLLQASRHGSGFRRLRPTTRNGLTGFSKSSLPTLSPLIPPNRSVVSASSPFGGSSEPWSSRRNGSSSIKASGGTP